MHAFVAGDVMGLERGQVTCSCEVPELLTFNDSEFRKRVYFQEYMSPNTCAGSLRVNSQALRYHLSPKTSAGWHGPLV